jgi:hypothetical protein
MKALTNILLLFGIITLSSCEKYWWQGACEYASKSRTYFYCEHQSSSDCKGSSYNDVSFHDGETCSDVGYSKKSSTAGITEWISPSGRSHPGYSSTFKNSSTSSTSGTSCSLDNYSGPTYDVQSASFCKSAFLYKCQGNSAGVTSSCTTYKQFQDMTPGLPTCSYCN